jgi:hypothetical protein
MTSTSEDAGMACLVPVVGLVPWMVVLFIVVGLALPGPLRKGLGWRTLVAAVVAGALALIWSVPVPTLGVIATCGTSPLPLSLCATPAGVRLWRAGRRKTAGALLALPGLAALVLIALMARG